ncbi:MAG TPA: MobA/MobL family protein [Alphaproteobacteria bacterium]|nr:MobA/MobL family protein [Alphaproteobacteria bacterium]
MSARAKRDDEDPKPAKKGLVDDEKLLKKLGLVGKGYSASAITVRLYAPAPRSSRPPMDAGRQLANGQTVYGTTFHFSHAVVKVKAGDYAAAARAAVRSQSYNERAVDFIKPADERDQAMKTGIVVDEVGPLRFGSVEMGASPRERRRFWEAAARQEYRNGGWVQGRLILELPYWIAPKEMRDLMRSWCAQEFGHRGLAWFASVHTPNVEHGSDRRNYHVHITYCTRHAIRRAPYMWAFTTKCREINARFSHRNFPWKTQETPGQRAKRLESILIRGRRRTKELSQEEIAQIKKDLEEARSHVAAGAKSRAENGSIKPQWVVNLRRSYAASVNALLERLAEEGQKVVRFYDARSYDDAGVRKSATPHMGARSTYLQRSGVPTPTGRDRDLKEYAWQIWCEHLATRRRNEIVDTACRDAERLIMALNGEWLARLPAVATRQVTELEKRLLTLVRTCRAVNAAETERIRSNVEALEQGAIVAPPDAPLYWARNRLAWLRYRERVLSRIKASGKAAGVQNPEDGRKRPIKPFLQFLRREQRKLINAFPELNGPDDGRREYLPVRERDPVHPALYGVRDDDAKLILALAGVPTGKPKEMPPRVVDAVPPSESFIGDPIDGPVSRHVQELRQSVLRWPTEIRLIERTAVLDEAVNCVVARQWPLKAKDYFELLRDLGTRGADSEARLDDALVSLRVKDDDLPAVRDLASRCAWTIHPDPHLLADLAERTGLTPKKSVFRQILGRKQSSQIRLAPLNDVLERARELNDDRAKWHALSQGAKFREDINVQNYITRRTDERLARLDAEILHDGLARIVAATDGKLAQVELHDRLRRTDLSPVQREVEIVRRPAPYLGPSLEPIHPSSMPPASSATNATAGREPADWTSPLPGRVENGEKPTNSPSPSPKSGSAPPTRDSPKGSKPQRGIEM